MILFIAFILFIDIAITVQASALFGLWASSMDIKDSVLRLQKSMIDNKKYFLFGRTKKKLK